jgi:hypothetical protein
MEAGKRNPWLTHVKKTLKAHKGKSFKVVLKMAKKTYKGGADVAPYSEGTDLSSAGPNNGSSAAPIHDAAPVGGRRRSRKGSKKGGRRHRTRKH